MLPVLKMRLHLWPWSRHMSTVFLVVCLTVFVDVCSSEQDIAKVYKNNDGNFQKLVLHEESQALFLGARNKLYRLSLDLAWQQQVTLGPAMDSHHCLNPEHECMFEQKLRDEQVKVLLASAEGDELLICGNLYQGSCAKVAARNVTQLTWAYEPVVGVASDAVFSSTAAVVTKDDELFVGNSVNTHTSTNNDNPLGTTRPTSPFIATRNYSTLGIRYRTGYVSSQMNIDPSTMFRAIHRSAFTYSKAVYFLVTRESNRNSDEAATFIGRSCKTDESYRSYVEALLSCDIGGIEYNYAEDAYVGTAGQRLAAALGISDTEQLLFVTFSQLEKSRWDLGRHSGLCVYRLSDVHRKLTQSIQMCFRGQGRTGPYHLAHPLPCKFTNFPIQDDYCGEHNLNSPIASTEVMTPVISQTFANTHLSAVTVSIIGPYTIVYLGTRSGKLLKVEVDSASRIIQYRSIPIHPGNVILPDMLVSSDGASLYTMTSTMVARVEVQDCGSHPTCDTCMASADPHCGWCSASKRCTADDACQAGVLGWNRTRTGRCPAIVSTQPNLTHASTPIKVTLTLTTTLARPDLTMCAVRVPGGSIDGEVRVINDKTLECKSSMTWPQLPHNIVSQKLTLDLVVGGHTWLSTNVTVYDCTRHRNCSECVTSPNPCAWCISSSRCTDSRTVNLIEHCGQEIYIYTSNYNSPRPSSGQSSGQGASFCPRIEQLGTEEPLLHSGIRGTVKVAGVQLPLEISNRRMTCRFESTEVAAVVVPSARGRHNITCPGVVLSYKKDVPFTSVPLSVLWGEHKTPLDNPHNLQLKLYDCEHMATSCGQCLTLDAHFQCGQCEGDCSRREKCPTTWHNRTYVCPNPLITRVQPLFGTLGGGTLLTIHGINLGQAKRHVEGGVKVGGHICTVTDYSPSTSIICVTPAMKTPKEAHIDVTVAGNFNTRASSPFGYVDPIIESIAPVRGPLAGGTNVTLTGRHLNIGTSLQVELHETRVKRKPGLSSMGKSFSTTVHRRSNDSVEFETQQMEGSQPMSLKVVVNVDGNQFPDDNLIFSYAENPTVTKVEPVVAIQSGGTLVTVHGSSLDVVQKPRLVVYVGDQERITPCNLLINETNKMTCLTPMLNNLHLGKGQRVTLNYGFIMDNVTQLLNVSGAGYLEPLLLYPDPVLDPVTKDTEYDLDHPLTLTGSHLGVLAHFSDFTVTVGGSLCNVTAINDTAIICQPTAQPEWLDNGKAQVVLEIQNHQSSPGWLQVQGSKPFYMELPFILAMVAIAIVIIAFILGICLCRRCQEEHKKSERHRLAGIEDPAAIPLTRVMSPREESAVVADMVASVTAAPTEATPLAGDDKLPEENGNTSGARNSYVSVVTDDAVMLKSLLRNLDPKLQETIQDVLIPNSHITLGDVLGKGHFGCVYSGTLQAPDTEEEPAKVAVKTLQGRSLDQEAVESFLREGVMMKNFDHPHVLRLLGVSVTERGENALVILPFMAAGDLRNYVKNKKKSFTARQLLQLGQQVAEGMAYLAQRGFIHRDLAARNCMVDENAQVKVADFGLSKDLYEKDYYSSVDRKRKMPIKWMALESLEDYVFTTKSDVWSFGVLLWELMIRGVTPYPDVDAFEMRNYLASGRRLRQPKFCPDNAYILMAECWRTDPDDRPTFADLVNRLELMVNPPRRNDSDTAGDEPLYVNIQRQPSIQNELEPEES